jgi:hypothetical protein
MIETEKSVPRELRTPITEADSAIDIALDVWVGMSLELNNLKDEIDTLINLESRFFSEIFGKAWDDPATNGDKSIDEIWLSRIDKRDTEVTYFFQLLEMINVVVAYAVQAMKAEKGGKHDEAWTYAVDAISFASSLGESWVGKDKNKNPASELAKKRHTKNQVLIKNVVKYWREKIDPTLSAAKAANKLVDVVPLSHKKISEIISKAKKEQS